MTSKLLLFTLAGVAVLNRAASLRAQDVPPSTATYVESDGPPTPPPTVALQAPTAFDKLVGPIALYPDPLISIVLPASTFPDQLEAANAFLIQYGDATQVDSQPWDASVRALAHYPSVVAWMVGNMSWTRALGAAFASSPSDVMDSVQKLRAIAEANGTLQATPQQSVVAEGDDIEIMPAQPDAIYVPAYDPNVVFADYSYGDYEGPFINFGDAYPVGIWLGFGFDWRNHRVWSGSPGLWRDRDGWHQPRYPARGAPEGARAWRSPGAASVLRHGPVTRGMPAVPQPIESAPNPPPEHYRTGPGVTLPGAKSGARSEPTPQPRPRLAPVEHSPLPGVDYTPPSRAPEYRSNAPGNREQRGQAPAPREPAEHYNVPVRSEPARAEPRETAHPAPRSEPAPRSAPAPREAPEGRPQH